MVGGKEVLGPLGQFYKSKLGRHRGPQARGPGLPDTEGLEGVWGPGVGCAG